MLLTGRLLPKSAGVPTHIQCKFPKCGTASLTDLLELCLCLPELRLQLQTRTVMKMVSAKVVIFTDMYRNTEQDLHGH